MNKQYIAMCRQATEIQKAWKPQEGDMTYVMRASQKLRLSVVDIEMVPIYNDYVWMPTIEDLIQRLQPEDIQYDNYATISTSVDYNMMRAFSDWLAKFPTSPSMDNNIVGYAANELWLCFVMHTLYNKSWNGESWII